MSRARSLLSVAHEVVHGVDMVEFGETINIIKDRRTVEGVSVLRQYEEAMKMWADHCTYEQIEGATRKTVEMVPKEAFREAVANALAHRTWDVNAHVGISVFKDRVEVASPGGLPAGITEDEYLSGRVSLLRNPILGNLLFRLRVIERFGTGVTRIREAYREQGLLPRFDILPNSILVSLPFINEVRGLSKNERMVYERLSGNVAMSNPQLADKVGFGLTKTRAVLERLVELGYARKVGAGRGTRYLR